MLQFSPLNEGSSGSSAGLLADRTHRLKSILVGIRDVKTQKHSRAFFRYSVSIFIQNTQLIACLSLYVLLPLDVYVYKKYRFYLQYSTVETYSESLNLEF